VALGVGTLLRTHRQEGDLDVRPSTIPADRSALDVIRQTVPGIAYSCQQGFCGTCRTQVLSGDIDHRDRVLTDRERTDTMTICVSRSRGDRIAVDL